MWLLYAFGAAFFAGITGILAKVGVSRNVDSTLATALRTIVVLIFSWLMVFIVGSYPTISTISSRTLVFLILSGVATGASWLFYFKALQLGNVNQVTPVDKSSTILAMILAFILLGEPLTGLMVIGMGLIGIGTGLMIQPASNVSTNERSSPPTWLIYAILSAFFASLTAILGKIGIQDVESNLGTAIRTGVVLVMAWGIVFWQGSHLRIQSIDRKSALFIILSGIATGLSWLFYYRALQDGLASIVVPIDKLSIVVTVAFSYFVLSESLSKRALIGLVLLVAGTLSLIIR
jgi:transporter family protein